MTLFGSELGFWPARARRNLNFFRCNKVLDLLLQSCSDINAGNWIHLSSSSLCWWKKLNCWLLGAFSFCGSTFGMIFFRFKLLLKLLLLGSITDLTANGLLSDFLCWDVLHFVVAISAWTSIFRDCQIVFLYRRLGIFRNSVWGVFWSVP